MKTYFTFENLYKAYTDCRKRKSNSLSCLKFTENLENNLLDLEEQLQHRTYQPGRAIVFVVKKPKLREIFASDFRDRVVHHLLYNYLSPIFERYFIYDSYACRKKKGTHKAMQRLKKFVFQAERESKGKSEELYCFQADIKNFFSSIDKNILYELIEKRIYNEEVLWLAKTIIFYDCARDIAPKIQSPLFYFEQLPKEKSLFTVPKGKGLPIGNLTSQFFANLYLNELDHFIKHGLSIRYYLRYVDDFVILEKSAATLKILKRKIIDFLDKKLKLFIHPVKQKIFLVKNGIDFVGYIVRADYVLVRRRVIWQWRQNIANCHLGKVSKINSAYMAHIKWANSYCLVKNILKAMQ